MSEEYWRDRYEEARDIITALTPAAHYTFEYKARWEHVSARFAEAEALLAEIRSTRYDRVEVFFPRIDCLLNETSHNWKLR